MLIVYVTFESNVKTLWAGKPHANSPLPSGGSPPVDGSLVFTLAHASIIKIVFNTCEYVRTHTEYTSEYPVLCSPIL